MRRRVPHHSKEQRLRFHGLPAPVRPLSRLSISQSPNVVAQPGLHVPRMVEAALHQLPNALLSARSTERSKESPPFRRNFLIRRQARNIYQPLGFRDRLFVERSNSSREMIDKLIELSIGKRPIDVPVELGQLAANIVCR